MEVLGIPDKQHTSHCEIILLYAITTAGTLLLFALKHKYLVPALIFVI